MEFGIIILIFILGAIFGSFGSVLVWRLRNGINFEIFSGILFGRSKCPSCSNCLDRKSLIPIISYIFTNGKCRFCGKNISLLYPIIEILSGVSFIFSFLITKNYLGYFNFSDYGFLSMFIFLCFLNWIFILYIIQDIWFFMLNIYIWLGSLFIILIVKFFGIYGDFSISFWGAIIMFIIFYLIHIFSIFYVKFRYGEKNLEGFGGGDVMIAFLMGLCFDTIFQVNGISFSIFNMMLLGLSYVIISSLSGLFFALISYFIYKGKQGKSIPFLPAMVIAYWILLIFGDKILF